MPYSEKQMVKAQIKPSPSLIYNNLCVAGGSAFYAHTRQACTLVLSGITASSIPVMVRKIESQHTDHIHCIRACAHNDATYIVVTTEAGVQVWDKGATHLLNVWSLPGKDPSTRHVSFCRGAAITVTGDGAAAICFGSSTGTLYVMAIADDGKFKAPVAFPHHTAPITCIASAYQSRQGKWTKDLGCDVVTCDEQGLIAIWKGATVAGFKVSLTIPSQGVPCVSAAVRTDFLVCARLDGAVQIYGLKDGKLRADIGAHSRLLTAMDIHPTKDIIATVAEDCTLNVWKLPIGGEKTQNLLSVCWLHAVLTGVAFCGPTSDDVAVVAYDTDDIHIYKAA